MTDKEIQLFLLKQEKRKENARHKEKMMKINNQINEIKKEIGDCSNK